MNGPDGVQTCNLPVTSFTFFLTQMLKKKTSERTNKQNKRFCPKRFVLHERRYGRPCMKFVKGIGLLVGQKFCVNAFLTTKMHTLQFTETVFSSFLEST